MLQCTTKVNEKGIPKLMIMFHETEHKLLETHIHKLNAMNIVESSLNLFIGADEAYLKDTTSFLRLGRRELKL